MIIIYKSKEAFLCPLTKFLSLPQFHQLDPNYTHIYHFWLLVDYKSVLTPLRARGYKEIM